MTWLEYWNNSVKDKEEIIYNAFKWEKFKDKVLYVSPKDIAEIVDLISSNIISFSSAKILFYELEDNRKKHAEECHKFISYYKNINLKR